MNQLIRAWQEAQSQSADQTLISYDGLGAVLAREQGGQTGGSRVQEFRNDAFGNVSGDSTAHRPGSSTTRHS